MNLSTATAAEVTRRKAATADDLAPIFPKFTVQQIVTALEYARERGLLHRAGKVRRVTGRPATLYAPGPEPEREPERVKRVPTSVWDLGLV